MDFSKEELKSYMLRAIELAYGCPTGIGKPFTGALVVSPQGEVVGEGCKQLIAGSRRTLHAERVAIEAAHDGIRNYAEGGALFTTLEPCKRINIGQRRQSCVDLIVERGIVNVIFGFPDFPHAAGGNILRSRGISVMQYTGYHDEILRLTDRGFYCRRI